MCVCTTPTATLATGVFVFVYPKPHHIGYPCVLFLSVMLTFVAAGAVTCVLQTISYIRCRKSLLCLVVGLVILAAGAFVLVYPPRPHLCSQVLFCFCLSKTTSGVSHVCSVRRSYVTGRRCFFCFLWKTKTHGYSSITHLYLSSKRPRMDLTCHGYTGSVQGGCHRHTCSVRGDSHAVP